MPEPAPARLRLIVQSFIRSAREGRGVQPMAKPASPSLFDPAILVPAVGSAFAKLDPRSLIKNPVMFVVGVVALLTTLLLVRDLAAGVERISFSFQIVLWLWFTLLFANFAEAVAEGRGKAQADALRQTRTGTRTKRLLMPDNRELWEGVAAEDLEAG